MKRRAAFTLTELLVALPIAAMLGALLLAPLDSAKQTLQGAQCLSNLRQWGLAMSLYSNDWNDYMPYLGGSSPGSLPLDAGFNIPGWFNSLSPYVGTPALKDLYNATPPRIPLPGMKSIFICPSVSPPAPAGQGSDSSNPYYSYQMNRVLTGSLAACPDNIYKRSKVALPSQVVFMCDSDNSGYSLTDGGFLAHSTPRHSGGDNFVFVDGHAAWESSSVYSNGFPAGTANANSEWITPKQIYWFPCRSCNKTCP